MTRNWRLWLRRCFSWTQASKTAAFTRCNFQAWRLAVACLPALVSWLLVKFRSQTCNHTCMPCWNLALDITGVFYSTPFVSSRIPRCCRVLRFLSRNPAATGRAIFVACLVKPAADRNECWVEPDIPRCQGRAALWVDYLRVRFRVDKIQGFFSRVASCYTVATVSCSFQYCRSVVRGGGPFLKSLICGSSCCSRASKPQLTERLGPES